MKEAWAALQTHSRFRVVLSSPCSEQAMVGNLHCTIENGIDIWRSRFREMAAVTQPVIITPLCAGCMQEEDHKRDSSTW